MTRYRVNRKPPVKPQGEWLRISHDMTWAIEDIADRDDMVVKFSEDAGFDDSAYKNGELIVDENGKPLGNQHPGVTFPGDGIVEINAHYLPDEIDPATMNVDMRRDRERYPVVWGILSHEGAHAHYSKWMDEIDQRNQRGELKPEQQPWIGAAIILEETRIEKKQIEFRPQDQVWLQASGTHLASEEVANEIKAAQAEGGEIPKYAVARSAALVLARIDAGSVTRDANTDVLVKLMESTFGQKDANTLRRIWLDAQSTGDYDADRMVALGKEWYEITGDAGDEAEQITIMVGGAGDGESDLEKALRQAAQAAQDEASGDGERARRQAEIARIVGEKRAEAQASREAKEKADGVFAGKGNNYSSPITGYRDATPEELSLARTTRRALQAAYLPERAVTQTTRNRPPGRLSVRAVQQQEAQASAGLFPRAEPFVYKDRMHVPTPPLKVGIIQDVSSSQNSAAAAAASGAWSLAKATTMIADAEVAMVSFGDSVQPIIDPYKKLGGVPKLSTHYGTQHFPEALQAIEGQLQLTRQGSARLVVILTDGYLTEWDLSRRDPAIKRLADMGVKFLWMVTSGTGDAEYVPMGIKGVHVYREASGNNQIIPKVINGEAVRALKK